MNHIWKCLLGLLLMLGTTAIGFAQTSFLQATTNEFAVDKKIPELAFAPGEFKLGLKLMNTSTFYWWRRTTLNASGNFETRRYLKDVEMFNLSPGIQVQSKRGFVHEFMLRRIDSRVAFQYDGQSLAKTQRTRGTTVNVNYGFYTKFFRNKTAPFAFMLGVELDPEFVLISRKPFTSTRFHSNLFVSSLRGNLVPRIAYYSKKRLYADISFPVQVFGILASRTKNEDPSLPNSEQTVWGTRWLDALPQITPQISIGIKL